MKKELSRLQIGIRSALRAIIPVFVTITGLYESGQLHSFHELFTPKGVSVLIAALATKGIFSGISAKSVIVKEDAH